MKRFGREFFERPTLRVAQELLGKFLVRKIPSTHSGQVAKIIRARITETEAYCGIKDLACHASKGLTERTRVMFGSAGFSYVYMIYGIYHCLNIVTEKEGNPTAVLIRAAEILNPKFQGEVSCGRALAGHRIASETLNKLQIQNSKTQTIKFKGPGILCRELSIDRTLNGVDICKSNKLWIEDGEIKIGRGQIKKRKRIGVDYAGKWKDKLWRFYL